MYNYCDFYTLYCIGYIVLALIQAFRYFYLIIFRKRKPNVGASCGYSILRFSIFDDISRTESTYENNSDKSCISKCKLRKGFEI